MQTISGPSTCTIDEIQPAEFAHLCWEAHPAVRAELAQYLHARVANNTGALFAAYDPAGKCVGRMEVELHPGYNTRGKPCATFGWLDGASGEVVNALLAAAAAWATALPPPQEGSGKRWNLLRGPISFPKHLGGIGCQKDGFAEPRMYTVPTNRPELGAWIISAGFTEDAPYACVDVTGTPVWDSAPGELPGFTLSTLSAEEWRQREGEVVDLGVAAFGDFLPDTVGGRFPQMLAATASVSDPFYSWPAALNSEGRLAGYILALPNVWDAWDGNPVVGLDVDTVVISPKYRGCGIFSAIHNKGVADTRAHMGIRYYEGTSIWLANEDAVKSIFPHGRINRRHVVYQKRLKKMGKGGSE